MSDSLSDFRAMMSSLPTAPIMAAARTTRVVKPARIPRTTPKRRSGVGIRYKCIVCGTSADGLPRYKVIIRNRKPYCQEHAEQLPSNAVVRCPVCKSDDWWLRWQTNIKDCLLVCSCDYVCNAREAGVDDMTIVVIGSPVKKWQ